MGELKIVLFTYNYFLVSLAFSQFLHYLPYTNIKFIININAMRAMFVSEYCCKSLKCFRPTGHRKGLSAQINFCLDFSYC